MTQEFYSNGKLLITGEYVVLEGALALAVPTKFGQRMMVSDRDDDLINWKSYEENGNLWIDETFSLNDFKNFQGNPTDDKSRLLKILQACHNLQPILKGYNISTHLTFPRLWGLGTSSTLINNLAQWLKIDAWDLLRLTFGGSGYDLACAKHNKPLVYQLQNNEPKIKLVDFYPAFANQLYFLYLNQKQNSQQEVARYFSQHRTKKQLLPFSKITKKLLETSSFDEFCFLMQKHEVLMSDLLKTASVQESIFLDFNGVIKSLGAWGGDFVLVISDKNPQEYFTSKGFDTLIRYQDMVL